MKIFILSILVLLSILSGISASPTTEVHSNDELSLRLPRTLKPVHYLVELQPYVNGNFNVDGFVEVTVDVHEATNKIILHINDIITHNETTQVFNVESPDVPLVIAKQEYLPELQYYVCTMADPLSARATYKISMKFQGYLNGDLKGFYRSSYEDAEGNTRWLATTQFQPTDARRAFPCMDEPGFKAKFTIHMIRQANMTSISNMPLEESTPMEDQQGWIRDKFQTTLPMSTYLVAFIVSDFGHITSDKSPDYDFQVWARKDYLDQGEYALKLGPEVMQYYEEFFNVSFPLPKQYMAAVPDMSLGAMENWGLIIYRESRFLYNPKSSTAYDRRTTGVIVAHELSHQWFGDLVTPQWWQDLWLNEGFASYMEYVGLDAVEPSFKMVDQHLIDAKHTAFTLDCLQTSHPINIPVNNPDEINQIFDRISYDKGSSIIRMMDHFLTRDVFRNGLHDYLVGMSYKVAEQDDLWRYLTDQAHQSGVLPEDLTVKTIMDTWTLQMGYPVVHVSRNTDGTYTISQERFLMVQNDDITDNHDYKWWIPITFSSQSHSNFNQTHPEEWMSPEKATKTIEIPEEEGWVVVNNLATGYYRVNYDQENWDKIAEQLMTDHKAIHSLNRAQLIADSLNLARAGKLPYETALNILAYLKKEKEYVPLKAGLQNIAYISSMFAHTGGFGRFKNFVLSLIVPHYEELQFKDSLEDPHLDQLLRTQILTMACDLGHAPCIQESQNLFKQWMADPENESLISPNLKSMVYCTAISEGGLDEWKFAWKKYTAATVSTEKITLLESLACSRSIWVLSELLNRTMTLGQGIRKQDVGYVMAAVSASSTGRLPAWNFLRNHWTSFTDYFGSIFFTLDRIITSVTTDLNTKTQLQEVKAFKETEKGNFYSAFRTIDQAIENTANNLQWMTQYYDVINNWLESNGYTSGL